MGYAETRFQRDIQLLKRLSKTAQNRERQTRQACLDVALALRETLTSLEGSATPIPAEIGRLVDQAKSLLEPDADTESAPDS